MQCETDPGLKEAIRIKKPTKALLNVARQIVCSDYQQNNTPRESPK
jgi:hypothetical protein